MKGREVAKKAKLKTPTLSDKLSEVILQGVKDLEFVEKNPKYKIDMGVYHDKEYSSWEDKKVSEKCAVCFAGAVIARAGNDPEKEIWPSYFDEKTANKLKALDAIRRGDLREALGLMRVKKLPKIVQVFVDSYVGDISVTPYERSPAKFKKEMREIAGELKSLGL